MLPRLVGLAIAGGLVLAGAAAAPPLVIVGLGLAVLLVRPRQLRRRTPSRRGRAGATRPRRAARPATVPLMSSGARSVLVLIAVSVFLVTQWRDRPDLGSVIASSLAANRALVTVLIVVMVAVVIGVLMLRVGRARRRQRWHVAPASTGGSRVAIGTAFEAEIAALLQRQGYRDVQRIGGAGDAGVDIVAADRLGRTVFVQCKRFGPGKRVGSLDVQKLIGAVAHQGAAAGLLVTTGTFTQQAKAVARSGQIPITLIDGNDLQRGNGRLLAGVAD